jgi:Mce-associated membrane protein
MSTSEATRPDGGTTSVVGDVPEVPAALAAAAGPEYATWGQRVVAAILDNATLAGVTWLALGAGYLQPSLTPVLGTAAEEGWPRHPAILVPVAALVALLVLQAQTGWTPGKLVVGIRVVREGSSTPAGLWTTLSRWVLHLLDAVLLIGYLQPLWHPKRQTFADRIAHTVVLQQLPHLPRRRRITVYSTALVTVVLGLGYCLPVNGGGSSEPQGFVECGQDGSAPFLTTGEVTLAGSVWTEWERRMWTVRETRTAHPGAMITWASDPSVRDVGYRVELDARPGSADGEPMISRSWDIGVGGVDDVSPDGSYLHTRNVAPDGDIHVAEVELVEADGDLGDLGTDVWVDVRLIADGDVVAACGGTMGYDDSDRVS